jgi:hypothetical protein
VEKIELVGKMAKMAQDAKTLTNVEKVDLINELRTATAKIKADLEKDDDEL